MRDEVILNITDLIQLAVNLANNVQIDIKNSGQISNETVLLLNAFRLKHNELSTILDVMNGIN